MRLPTSVHTTHPDIAFVEFPVYYNHRIIKFYIFKLFMHKLLSNCGDNSALNVLVKPV